MSIVKNMFEFYKSALIFSVLCVSNIAIAAPSNSELDQRLSALEMRLSSNYARIGKLERSSSSDLLLEVMQRLDALERDNANLRGLLEVNQNNLEKQTENIRQLSLELDRRLENASDTIDAEQNNMQQAAASTDPVAERKLYEAAFKKLREGKNSAAVSAFAEYLRAYPQGRFADNAQYWLAEAYYIDGKANNAKNAFNNLLKKYPRSSKVPDTLLKLGYIAIDTGEIASAKQILAKLQQKYAGSNAAKLAKQRLLALGE